MSTKEFDPGNLADNLDSLRENPYPGRGIVLGVATNGDSTIAYWVMGRSENSRNRILVRHDQRIETKPYDASKVVDSSLIIYNALDAIGVTHGGAHVVSNGDQTDTVMHKIELGNEKSLAAAFREGLLSRDYEPDAPNFTTRITGMIARIGSETKTYNYSLISRNPYTEASEHTFGSGLLSDIPDGAGIAFHTYEGDGDPLPAFRGSPYPIPLEGSAQETAEALWDVLDRDNRVAIAVKTIDQASRFGYHIINALGGKQ